MEIIDIGLSDLEPISMNFGESNKNSMNFGGETTKNSMNFGESNKPSVNFGTGIELLMNDKKKSSSSTMNIDLGELDKLENELNELSGANSNTSKSVSYSAGPSTTSETKTLSGFASNLFNIGSNMSSSIGTTFGLNNSPEKNDSKVGEATVESIGNSKT